MIRLSADRLGRAEGTIKAALALALFAAIPLGLLLFQGQPLFYVSVLTPLIAGALVAKIYFSAMRRQYLQSSDNAQGKARVAKDPVCMAS